MSLVIQQKAICLSKPIREEAITGLYCNTVPRSLAIADLGCSRHMTGDKCKPSDFVSKGGGYVMFGDNSKEKIVGETNIGKN